MRIQPTLRIALVFLAFTLPTLLRAQMLTPDSNEFRAPNPDELKMTSDPKAPGAAAVYLEINENDNDPMHYETYYARIKVLTDKGKELATQELRYVANNFKIHDIKGRTIHADGTVIPLNVKPEDLLVVKVGELQENKKVFTLPSVEVGSILEFKYQLDYDDNAYFSPTWNVQQKYFVHKAHYEFTPFKAFLPGGTSMELMNSRGELINALLWYGNLPKGVTVQQAPATGRFSLDVSDIPPTPDEEYMPPIQSQLLSA